MSKLAQPVVLYLSARENNGYKGFACGTCVMGIKDTAECTILIPPAVDLDHGVCGFYVPGPNVRSTTDPPMKILKRATAGYYASAAHVPTHCGNCRHFLPAGQGACESVEGQIDRWGCCNGWEAGTPAAKPRGQITVRGRHG